ncbi:alpha/beta hydrolase [Gilvimarinus agarilyticus]|uniref:alpha/beta hydrolase n=1 Tax=Gilvimarinus agarilyticus TaxID=679259 RepID=UPI0005A0A3E6|nr:alpha/beta fold hydrolase [Gilvimarinus agarilyticus]
MARVLRWRLGLVAAIGLVAAFVWLLFTAVDTPKQVSAAINLNAPGRWQEAPCPPATDVEVTCGRWHTPGGQFKLPVVVVHYRGADKQAEPILYLQGGPGAGADINDGRALERWRDWRDFAGLRRDLVLIDRRGTGASTPLPVCHAYERFSADVLRRNLSLQQEWLEARQVLQQCLTSMPEFHPLDYGTRVSAKDIYSLGHALGVKRWHVLGVSYGSRLALALQAESLANSEGPELASMVLDSVYPPERGGFIEWPGTLARALAGFYNACSEDVDCQSAWRRHNPGEPVSAQALEAALFNGLATLRTMPMQVDVRVDGLPKRMVVNDHRFLAAVFAASYHRHRWADVVSALSAVRERDRAPLQQLMQLFVSQALSDSITSLTFMAVDCRDNRLGTQREFSAELARHGPLRPYLEGMWQDQICLQWPTGHPLELPPPPQRVALLAGEFDPITPASWARELQRQWPLSKLTEFEGIGHHVLGSKSCALAQLEAFLAGRREQWEACADD